MLILGKDSHSDLRRLWGSALLLLCLAPGVSLQASETKLKAKAAQEPSVRKDMLSWLEGKNCQGRYFVSGEQDGAGDFRFRFAKNEEIKFWVKEDGNAEAFLMHWKKADNSFLVEKVAEKIGEEQSKEKGAPPGPNKSLLESVRTGDVDDILERFFFSAPGKALLRSLVLDFFLIAEASRFSPASVLQLTESIDEEQKPVILQKGSLPILGDLELRWVLDEVSKKPEFTKLRLGERFDLLFAWRSCTGA